MESAQPKRVLVTGASGFIGSYLTEYLLQLPEPLEVYGTVRWLSCTDRITDFPKGLNLLECDLKDYSNVFNIINTIQPDVIFHLAGPSDVAASWLSPTVSTIETVEMQQHIFQAIRAAKLEERCKVVLPLSAQEYGVVKDYQLPIDEATALRPVSPYGVGKVMQDMLALQNYLGFGVQSVRVRLFNVAGPGQSDVFVLSHIAKQIAEAEAGVNKGAKVMVGNVATRRDWTDVRDVVKALWLAAIKGQPGEAYVIASGKSYGIDEVIDRFQRLTRTQLNVEIVHQAARPTDIPNLVGNSRVFRELTYWEPLIGFDQTLEDMLNAWRLRVKFLNRLGDIMRGFQQGQLIASAGMTASVSELAMVTAESEEPSVESEVEATADDREPQPVSGD